MSVWRRWIGGENRGALDRWLLGGVLLLSAVGLLMVYSSSSAMGVVGHRGNDLFYLQSQMTRWFVGLLLLLGLSQIEVRNLGGRLGWALWGFTAALLVFTLFFGVEVRGARRWIMIGSSLVQPSEFARLAMLVLLAGTLSRLRGRLNTWRGLAAPMGVTMATAALIAVEPHLSMAILVGGSGMALIFLAGGSLWRLLVSSLAGGGLALLAGRAYHATRWSTFVQGMQGEGGYQALQSKLGIASGGLFGMGLGQGMQKHFFLPDPHTDFILSIIGEELGFVGIVALLALATWLVLRIFGIGSKAGTAFSSLLAWGVGLQLMLGFLVHTVVCLGWGPTTGVPFPLISFGGSALIANMIALGLVLSISRRGGAPEPAPNYLGGLLMVAPRGGRGGR